MSVTPEAAMIVPLLFLAVLLTYLVPYLRDPHGLRSYPGPFLAKFSKLWFARAAFQGRTGIYVRQRHEKYGTFVRISPDEVSIADPQALQAIYSHSSGTRKSSLYAAFDAIPNAHSVFTVRSREDHARKRKMLAHTMTPKTLADFEPLIYQHERTLVQHWDEMCAAGKSYPSGQRGDCSWTARDGRVWFDCVPWYNYQAFDVIGDLAFGAPFGMLAAAQDAAPVAESEADALASFDADSEKNSFKYRTVPAVETISGSNAFNTFLGCLPEWTRPLIMSLPIFKESLHHRKAIGTMAVTAVSKRIGMEKQVLRRDFLTKLLESRDAEGQSLSGLELSSEALNLLIAGSDTTANTAAAITYYLAQNRGAQSKLQRELDKALGPPDHSLAIEDSVADGCYGKIKDCQYLQAVINEGLRMHSTVCIGLPREVPEGGLSVLGRTFAAGTILSVPSLTLHRLKSVWGSDADVFDPDRWAVDDKSAMQQAFSPYSVGPRACLGRSMAQMELLITISTIFHRYDVVLSAANQELEVHEGFLRKACKVDIGIKLRHTPAH